MAQLDLVPGFTWGGRSYDTGLSGTYSYRSYGYPAVNQLAIRAGDRRFSEILVTRRVGYLWRGRRRVPCPAEAAYFAALGTLSVPVPEERHVETALRLRTRSR